MSRDESDLRAALRAGEGDGVDADRVIGQALAARHARRTRWATVAASAVVVAALGSGVGALAHFAGSDRGERALSSAGSANANGAATSDRTGTDFGGLRAAPEAAATPPSAGAGAAGGASTAGICPPTPPAVPTPASGAANAADPLFEGRISSVTACGFRAERAGGSPVFVRGSVFTGDAARRLVASLNAAPARPVGGECHSGAPGSLPMALVFYATAPSGAEPPVVMNRTCDLPATNGAAVRYDWTPPADLAAKLDALTRP